MACNLAEWVTGVGIAIFAILAVNGLFQYSRFVKILRVLHPMKWLDLGKPELATIEGSQTDRATSVFLLKAYYRDLNDPELTKLGDRMRVLGFVDIAIVLVALLVLVSHLDGNVSRLTCFMR